MSIRKAKIEDAVEIKALISSLSHFYLENKNTPVPAWFLKTLDISAFERRLENDWFTNFVYIDEGEIVGYISIRGGCHLFHLFVAENHHKKGISKALWHYSISDLSASVYTLRSSIYAVPVYKRFGFKEYGIIEIKEGIFFQPMKWLR